MKMQPYPPTMPLTSLELIRVLLAAISGDSAALAALIKAGNTAAVGDDALVTSDPNTQEKIRALMGAPGNEKSLYDLQQELLNIQSGDSLASVKTAIDGLWTLIDTIADLQKLTDLKDAIDLVRTTLIGAGSKDLTTIDALLTILASAINQTDATFRGEILSTTPPTNNVKPLTAMTGPGYSDIIEISNDTHRELHLTMSGHTTGDTIAVRVLTSDAVLSATPVAPDVFADANSDPATAMGIVPIIIGGMVTGTPRNFKIKFNGKSNWACLHWISETGSGAVVVTPTYLGGR